MTNRKVQWFLGRPGFLDVQVYSKQTYIQSPQTLVLILISIAFILSISGAESISNVGVYFTNYVRILAISEGGGCSKKKTVLHAHYAVVGTKSDCATHRTKKPVFATL